MEIVCVALAAWAFDRLAVARFGRAGRAGAIVFAVGTVVQVAIGQEPYLLGETLGARRAGRGARRALAAGAAAGARDLAREPARGRLPRDGRDRLARSAAGRRGAGAPSRSRPRPRCRCWCSRCSSRASGRCRSRRSTSSAWSRRSCLIGFVVARRDRTLAVGVALYAVALRRRLRGAERDRQQHRRGWAICFGVALRDVALAWDGGRARVLLVAAARAARAGAVGAGAPGAAGRRQRRRRQAAYFQPLLRYLDARRPPARARRGRADGASLGGRLRRAVLPARARLGAPARHRQQPIFYERGRLTRGELPRLAVRQRRALRRAARRRRSTTRRWPRRGSCAPACRGCVQVWRSAHWRVFAVVGRARARQRPGAAAQLERRGGAARASTRARRGHRARALRRRVERRERRGAARPRARRLAPGARAPRPGRSCCASAL